MPTTADVETLIAAQDTASKCTLCPACARARACAQRRSRDPQRAPLRSARSFGDRSHQRAGTRRAHRAHRRGCGPESRRRRGDHRCARPLPDAGALGQPSALRRRRRHARSRQRRHQFARHGQRHRRIPEARRAFRRTAPRSVRACSRPASSMAPANSPARPRCASTPPRKRIKDVDWYADHGYVQIKIYSSVKPELVPIIADRAHALGLRVSGHVPAFMSAQQFVEGGADEIQHLNFIELNFLWPEVKETRNRDRFIKVAEHAREFTPDKPAGARLHRIPEAPSHRARSDDGRLRRPVRRRSRRADAGPGRDRAALSAADPPRAAERRARCAQGQGRRLPRSVSVDAETTEGAVRRRRHDHSGHRRSRRLHAASRARTLRAAPALRRAKCCAWRR